MCSQHLTFAAGTARILMPVLAGDLCFRRNLDLVVTAVKGRQQIGSRCNYKAPVAP